jgi:hypothetical protein
MSTTPPEQPTTPRSDYDRTGGPTSVNLNLPATMPIPGNAELLIYLLAVIVIAIISLAADSVDSPQFVLAFTVLTFAYLISRGIAKASRVLEQ